MNKPINNDDCEDDRISSNAAVIEWDEKGQPLSAQFKDVYFSPKDGLEESRYVFIEHNQLTKRFARLKSGDSFVVAEAGFGTGLNFLSCWQHWLDHAPRDAQLSFISVEKYPLSPDDLARSLALWPSLSKLANKLCHCYEMSFTSTQAPQYKTLNFGNVRLLLLIDDAESGFRRLLHTHDREATQNFSQSSLTIKPGWDGVDAWFLDGFTPSRNPEMWTKSLYHSMALLSRQETTFSTFTAASAVRHDLTAVGFDVTRASGFGSKREMLYGVFNVPRFSAEAMQATQNSFTKPSSSSPSNASSKKPLGSNKQTKNTTTLTPWAVTKDFKTLTQDQSIAIIGAGLAGCHSANALAKRGFKVTLIDRHNTIAAAASGNPQGVLYAKLSAHAQTLSDFNLQALLHAQHFYQHYWTNSDNGDCCGVLQLSYNDNIKKNHQAINKNLQYSKAIKFVDAKQASSIANVQIKHSALYFPYCGWLKPQSLCQQLCDHKNITVINNIHIASLEQDKSSSSWLLVGQQMDNATEERQNDRLKDKLSWRQQFDQVIIANASDAKRFEQTQWLPTKPVRGQISYLKTQAPFDQLRSVICAEGYIPPATSISVDGEATQIHALGASFNLHSTNESITDDDHLNNLANVTKYFTDQLVTTEPSKNPNNKPKQTAKPPKTQDTPVIKGGRVGFRCTSPDYLPLVGPAPVYEVFNKNYKPLSRDAKTFVAELGSYYPGLYINIAHGSRGLAYTPITAELLACTMAKHPLPMSQEMAKALNPGRFIIRDLIRSQKSE
jgi:tRNA 5-methylaminomethyl-2-thiouridine biosynthesis bifunctional protein